MVAILIIIQILALFAQYLLLRALGKNVIPLLKISLEVNQRMLTEINSRNPYAGASDGGKLLAQQLRQRRGAD